MTLEFIIKIHMILGYDGFGGQPEWTSEAQGVKEIVTAYSVS